MINENKRKKMMPAKIVVALAAFIIAFAGVTSIVSSDDTDALDVSGTTENYGLVVFTPEAKTNLVYNGTEQTGVSSSEDYTLTDNTATNAGTYTATATLNSTSAEWDDGTTGPKSITWSIAKATISKVEIKSGVTFTYIGDAIVPTFDQLTITVSGGTIAASDVDITAVNNTNAGTATVTVTAKTDSTNFTGSASCSFTINQKAVTVTADDQSKEYGYSDPDLTATVVGTIGSDTVSYTVSRDDGEELGGYTITPSGEESQGNYSVTYVNGTFTITARSISGATITLGDALTYNGAKQTQTVSSVVKDGYEATFTVSNNEGTDAGDYYLTVTGTGNFTGSETKMFTIAQKAVTVTADDKSKTYGGSDPELTATVSGTISPDTVSYTVTRAAGENATTYTITPSGNTSQGNYSVSYVAGTFTINKAELTPSVDFSNIVVKIYDGGNNVAGIPAISLSGAIIGESPTATATSYALTSKDVGTKDVKATGISLTSAWSTNYELKYSEVTSTNTLSLVSAKDVYAKDVVWATCLQEDLTYSGSDLSHYIYASFKGVGSDGIINLTLSFLGTSGAASGQTEFKRAGEYTVTGTNTDANYVLYTCKHTYEIAKKQLSISIPTVADKKYNGLDDDASITIGNVSGKVGSDDVTVSASGEYSSKDAGTVTCYVTYDLNGDDALNYEKPVAESVNANILPRDITLTSDSDSKTYDGTAITKCSVTVSEDGFVDGEGATYNFTGTQTYKGTSKNGFTYTLNDNTGAVNYNIKTAEGDLTVNAIATPIIITTASDSKKYDGTALQNFNYTFTPNILVEGDTLSVSMDTSITDAGSVDNAIKSITVYNSSSTDITECYTFGTHILGKLSITPREITLTSASNSKKYDGTALSNENVTVSGDGFISGQGATYNVTGSQTDTGSSKNAFGYTLDEGTKADNYNITTVEGDLTVSKRAIVMTSGSSTKVYDKKPLTNSDVTVTGDGFAASENATYDVTGTRTVYGTSDNEFTYTLIDGAKAGNYDISTVFGKLTVEKLTVDVPKDLYYIGTGSEITFDIPTSEWYTIEDKEKKGTAVGTYTFVLTLDSSCTWSPASYDGNYHVYITDKSREHINDEGKTDVIITGENGIRADLTLTVKSTKDVTDIKQKYKFDGNASYVYDVKLMNGSEETQPVGSVTLALMFSDNVSRYSYSLYHIHDDVCEKVDSSPDGNYAMVTVDGLSEFVFVVPDKGETSNTALWIALGAAVAIAAIILIASRVYIKRKA